MMSSDGEEEAEEDIIAELCACPALNLAYLELQESLRELQGSLRAAFRNGWSSKAPTSGP